MQDGLIRVSKNGSGYIDLSGKVIIHPVYQGLDIPSEGMIGFMHEPQKWGFINYKNEVIIEPQFSYVAPFKDGKVILQKGDGQTYTVYKDGRIEKDKM